MKIAFICVNYNNSDVTLDYILNVNRVKGTYDVKIIVVDNDSEIKDVINLDHQITQHSDVVLIKSKTNLGYFKGLNLGMVWALANGFDQYQVIGNNDIKFFDNFLVNLERLSLDDNELIVSPDIITVNGIHENPHVIKRVSSWKKFMFDIYYSSYYIAKITNFFYTDERKPKAFDPERKHIYMGNGATYVLTPNFFKYFNKLWDGVFLYGEEALLAGQISSVNGKIVYEPLLKCRHNASSTTSRLGAREKYYIVKESYKIYRKYLSGNE